MSPINFEYLLFEYYKGSWTFKFFKLFNLSSSLNLLINFSDTLTPRLKNKTVKQKIEGKLNFTNLESEKLLKTLTASRDLYSGRRWRELRWYCWVGPHKRARAHRYTTKASWIKYECFTMAIVRTGRDGHRCPDRYRCTRCYRRRQ